VSESRNYLETFFAHYLSLKKHELWVCGVGIIAVVYVDRSHTCVLVNKNINSFRMVA